MWKQRSARRRDVRHYLEALEKRELLSAAVTGAKLTRKITAATAVAHNMLLRRNQTPRNFTLLATPHSTVPSSNWHTPAEIRKAYGMDQVMFGDIVGDGLGQTIAIIGAYHYPTAYSDLQGFSQYFGLPVLNEYVNSDSTAPYFRQVAWNGTTDFSFGPDPAGPSGATGVNTWSMEAALDIQWAHAMAPKANIILVEASSNTFSAMVYGAAGWARQEPGVSVISMSFGSVEYAQETQFDSTFTTPAGHQGITFIASTGDYGSPGQYPASSPNVVAVGGTSLYLDASGNYSSEVGWSGSGGGPSDWEARPAYQAGVLPASTKRGSPDISLVADPGTGVAVFDSWDYPNGGWFGAGGTSLAAPMFGGMIAVANQGRNYIGLGTLDGRNETLPLLYTLPSTTFHDITSGSNGAYAAGPGYDFVTGLGTPKAQQLYNGLVGVVGSISGRAYADNNGDGLFNETDVPQAGMTVFLDTNGNGLLDTGGTQTVASGTVNATIPDNSTAGVTVPLTLAGLGGVVTNIAINFTINHQRNTNLSAYLIGPDGTQVTLFQQIGSNFGQQGFTNTTLSGTASTFIGSVSAPFTGTYKPSGFLSNFNGKSANGIWKLKVVDSVNTRTGSITNWSITVATGSEKNTVTASDGTYAFHPVLGGSYNVRQVIPSGYSQSAPTTTSFNITGQTTGVDFVNLPTTFAASGSNNGFYVWLDQDKINIGNGNTPSNPLYKLPVSTVPNLAFNLGSGTGGVLTLDLSGGVPLPLAANISVNGGSLPNSQIVIEGAGHEVTLSGTQLIPDVGTGVLNFSNVGIMTLRNTIVDFYSAGFRNFNTLNVLAGSTLNWN